MVSSRLRGARLLLLILLVISLRLALALPGEAAAPFVSPGAAPSVAPGTYLWNGSVQALLPRLDIEGQGFPISWILGLLLLLFIPATAVVAARYRR